VPEGVSSWRGSPGANARCAAAHGRSNKEIAQDRRCQKTVKTHVSNILSKLGWLTARDQRCAAASSSRRRRQILLDEHRSLRTSSLR
jgi:hypothetical protein